MDYIIRKSIAGSGLGFLKNSNSPPAFMFNNVNSTTPVLNTSHVIWAIIDGGLMFAILSGNILTICAVKLSRKLSRTVANQFILSLAISDFFVGLTLPYHLAFYIGGDVLARRQFTCILRFVLISMACCASIYNLIAIALDRYVAIIYPLHYNRYMTKRMASIIIFIGWILSTSVSTLPIYWNSWDHRKTQECELHIVLPKYYVTLIMAPYFATVWATLFILYVRIWREAVEHAKRLRSTSYYQSGFVQKKDWKSVQVVLLVLGCFSICWLPYLIVACFQATEQPDHVSNRLKIFYKSAFSLAMANSGMNPIIYAWKNASFRRAFTRLLRCQRPDCSEYNPSYRNNYAPNSSINSKMGSTHGATIAHISGNSLEPYSTIDCKLKNSNGVTPNKNDNLVLYDRSLRHIESTVTIITNEHFNDFDGGENL